MLLEAFYVENKDKLIARLTRFSGDREASSDAVQEAFLKALKNRALLSAMPEKSLWAWLYASAKNALIDEKRKTSRYDLHDGRDEADPAGDPTDAIMVKELLHKLPPNLIHTVSLKYFGGMTSTEIGKMKGIPASSVRSQLRAALKLMKTRVSIYDL